MGNTVGALGAVATGVGSVLSTGISYIGSFRPGQQAQPDNPSKMMGFGSDSYQGYMGSGSSGGYSSNYAPPGGQQSSLSSSNIEKKWGATSSPRQNDYKPMGGASTNKFESKTATTSGVPIVQIKEENHKKIKRKQSSSSSSSMSEEEVEAKKKQKKPVEQK